MIETIAEHSDAALPAFRFEGLPCGCCGARSERVLGDRGGKAHRSGAGIQSRIVRCRACGHVYPSPMPMLQDTNAGYQGVEGYFAQHDPSEKLERGRRLLERLERALGRKGRLLDVGAGRGELLAAAKAQGWQPTGVETSAEFAAFARATYGVDVKHGTLEAAAFPAGSFDVVTLGAVIEHLYEPRAVLQQVHRVLRAGGLVWIDAPNEMSLYNLAGNLYFRLRGRRWVCQLSPTFPPYHVQGFTVRSLPKLVTMCGFDVQEHLVYSGRVLLPHRTFSEHIEYAGAVAVHALAEALRMGSFMEVIARRDGSAS